MAGVLLTVCASGCRVDSAKRLALRAADVELMEGSVTCISARRARRSSIWSSKRDELKLSRDGTWLEAIAVDG